MRGLPVLTESQVEDCHFLADAMTFERPVSYVRAITKLGARLGLAYLRFRQDRLS